MMLICLAKVLNSGLGGRDLLALDTSFHTVDVTGIAEHTLTSLNLCTFAGLIESTIGPIIGIFHQYASYPSGPTIHSVAQLEHFGLRVDDRSRSVNGTQRIITPDGYIFPLSIRDGLAYLDMSLPTLKDVSSFPHVMFTADVPWDSRVCWIMNISRLITPPCSYLTTLVTMIQGLMILGRSSILCRTTLFSHNV